jgi:hypothetical protein
VFRRHSPFDHHYEAVAAFVSMIAETIIKKWPLTLWYRGVARRRTTEFFEKRDCASEVVTLSNW